VASQPFPRKARHDLAQRLAAATLAHPDLCGQILAKERRGWRGGAEDLAELALRLAITTPPAEPCCPACFIEGRLAPLLCTVLIHQHYHRALARHEKERTRVAAPPPPAPPPPPALILDTVDRFDLERQCTSKKRYPQAGIAAGVAARCFAERGHALRAYACTLCGGFHLTRQLRSRYAP
jgi:hypothetical protein